MRKTNLAEMLLFGIMILGVITNCSKDEPKQLDVSPNTISAKWEISDSKSPYESFEFNKYGNYIVVEKGAGVSTKSAIVNVNNALFIGKQLGKISTRAANSESDIHFGTYTINGNKIILENFGLIEVTGITNEELSFSFTLNSTGEKITIKAEKTEEMPSSSRTEMLCRTWVIVSSDLEGTIVLFSKAGTYFVTGIDFGGLSNWKWANNEETRMYYSWDNWTDDWIDNIVTITELTTTKLVINEDGEIHELIPKE